MQYKVPWPLQGDAYTVSGNAIASEQAKQCSVYNFTNRISPKDAFPEVAQDSRMVFYGLSEFIKRHLATQVTHADIDESIKFMKTAHSFGGPLQFDPEPWRAVVDEYDGYLPISIKAIPEGSTFFPNEPIIEVTSACGFGEIAAIIEAVMVGMVSVASAKATLTRHWLQRIREWVSNDLCTNDPAVLDMQARFMIHDFGMRACSCSEESELLGLAHLLTFHGTDTFNAAYLAWKMGAQRPTGTSILALAHRIVQGHDSEVSAFDTLETASEENSFPIASYVADCYNFESALLELSQMAKHVPETTYVVRPDSGPYVQNTLDIANVADLNGLAEQDPNTGYYKAKNLRFINGDSMNPDKVNEIFQALSDEGYSPTQWGIFGVGGYLVNTPNRDSLSSAYKLCAKSNDEIPVVKLSEIPEKMSIPGPNILNRGDILATGSVFMERETDLDDERDYYYIRGYVKNMVTESFHKKQTRCIHDFDAWSEIAETYPELGLNRTLLSEGVTSIQNKVFDYHRGN